MGRQGEGAPSVERQLATARRAAVPAGRAGSSPGRLGSQGPDVVDGEPPAGLLARCAANSGPAGRPAGRRFQQGSATMQDVARLAGVSPQTVSRVLNGHPNVRPATRALVLEALRKLRFRPNTAARVLRGGRSGTLGVLVVAAGTHYGPASCVAAVEGAARERGYRVTVARAASATPESVTAAMYDLVSYNVDGAVIVAPGRASLTGLQMLADIPLVATWGKQPEASGLPAVSVDQQAGVRMLMRYLLAQGHRRIVHLAGPAGWDDARFRLEAYAAELRLAGLPVLPAVSGDWTAESGFTAGRELLRNRPVRGGADLRFSAVFAANDQMALGLVRAFNEAGIEVPRDVSVAGFDDIPEAEYFWPPLTTVHQDFIELGRRSIDLLINAIDRSAGEPSAAAVPAAGVPAAVEPRLVVRNSVGSVAPPTGYKAK